MKFTNLLLLAPIVACATEYEPWFTPPFEFQGRIGYRYEHSNSVQSPLGSFAEPTRDSSAHLSLAVTPWPHWNVEAELFFTRTSDIAFTYESTWLTARYAWLDDIAGDCLSFVTGVTLSFPSKYFLHAFSFPYHGHANAELHATCGKEWSCGSDWHTRLWGLIGYGVAEKGSPWVHGIGTFEYHFPSCAVLGFFTEALYGFGHDDIVPFVPFTGYASIEHQSIDLGGYMDYEIRYWGTLKLLGWYRVHARNFTENNWGASLTLLVPFSII